MSSKVEPKTIVELEGMHTGSLMSRRKFLLQCEESGEVKVSESDAIEFKNTPEWKQAYKELKTVLATRENVPSKKERKEMRKSKAKSRK